MPPATSSHLIIVCWMWSGSPRYGTPFRGRWHKSMQPMHLIDWINRWPYKICPAMAHILINIYRNNSCLFVGGQCSPSEEDTTQGDPLAVAMYANGTLLQTRWHCQTNFVCEWLSSGLEFLEIPVMELGLLYEYLLKCTSRSKHSTWTKLGKCSMTLWWRYQTKETIPKGCYEHSFLCQAVCTQESGRMSIRHLKVRYVCSESTSHSLCSLHPWPGAKLPSTSSWLRPVRDQLTSNSQVKFTNMLLLLLLPFICCCHSQFNLSSYICITLCQETVLLCALILLYCPSSPPLPKMYTCTCTFKTCMTSIFSETLPWSWKFFFW